MSVSLQECLWHLPEDMAAETNRYVNTNLYNINRQSAKHPHLAHLKKHTPWPESASELYRPSDHRLSAKLVPTFADRGYHMVSVTNLYGRILGFLDRAHLEIP
jgi:hypothetical protein